MSQRALLLILLIIFIMTSACSKDKQTFDERLEQYTTAWINFKFNEMYDMLTDETKQNYETTKFIDRYEKIYNDIDVSDLSITYSKLSKQEIRDANKNKQIDIPLNITFNSIAGKIDFTSNIQLIQIEEDKQVKWQVNWNPGLILPELDDDGEVRISTTNPKRGEILDRNRMPLAINDTVYEVGIVPERLIDEKEEISQIANLLGISVSTIEQQLNAGWVEPHLFVPLKKVPNNNVNIISHTNTIPSFTYREANGRTYPSGKAAAHLIGYIGKITNEEFENVDQTQYSQDDKIGKRGLEQLFEERLKGKKGVKISVIKEDEETLIAEKPVKDGDNVMITIDINVQEGIFNAYNNHAGTASAIDPKTGEVLALVSSPAFEPNELLYGISDKSWQQLQNDPKQPLINRFASTFAPGSVLKPITAAIGLENGTIKPNEALTINGLTWGKNNWGNYKVKRVSDTKTAVNLQDALKQSDNIYFAQQTVKMGDKKYTKGLEDFGFNKDIPFTYPVSKSQISNEGKLKDEILLANTSYGQGEIEVTPLHMALAYTPLLNDGNLTKPTLLLDEKKNQIWQESVIKKDNAQTVNDMLRKVVTDGTATVADREDLKISGKTGTAELKLTADSDGHENGWFVGYPTDTEDIIIAMMIEQVENDGGSSFVAKKVADILVDYKK